MWRYYRLEPEEEKPWEAPVAQEEEEEESFQ